MHDWFEQQLRQVFEAAGWRVQQPKRPDVDIDFLVELPPHRYAIEVKVAKESRRQLQEGGLASAILRARAAAPLLDAKPMAVVCAPSISDALLRELGDFAARYGEGIAWGALDRSGLVSFSGHGLESLSRARRSAPRASPVVARPDSFSDLGQWMLKVVLSHRLPAELRARSLSGDREIDRPISSALELARVANVSVPSASRFLASMRDERFIVDGVPINVIREGDLLSRWRSAHQKRPRELRARWLFPQKDSQLHLEEVLRHRRQLPGSRACLGLFAACDRLGFRFVSGVAPHVYLENISVESVHEIGLRVAEPGESADVFLREPRFQESVFRGASRHDGIPVSDILQCWIDVADHPARGEEMAAHLYERVIAPKILGDA